VARSLCQCLRAALVSAALRTYASHALKEAVGVCDARIACAEAACLLSVSCLLALIGTKARKLTQKALLLAAPGQMNHTRLKRQQAVACGDWCGEGDCPGTRGSDICICCIRPSTCGGCACCCGGSGCPGAGGRCSDCREVCALFALLRQYLNFCTSTASKLSTWQPN
jgi:hypothetical protein